MDIKRKILIVEDEKELKNILFDDLKARGYTVYAADDGEEALKIAEEVVPDLIITDVVMPKLDGSKLVKHVRDTYFGKKTAFIIITARVGMQDYFRTIGVDDFIEKPFKLTRLISSVENILMRSQSVTNKEINKRVLVAGCNSEVVNKMAEQLRGEKCHTDLVNSGDQVISKAVLFLPNVILIEEDMYGMHSSENIKILRQMPQFKKITILVYSCRKNIEESKEENESAEVSSAIVVNKCLDAGATAAIGVYDDNTFIHVVNRYIKQGTIIIIDDDMSMAKLLKNDLELSGYNAIAVRDGKEGLTQIQSVMPDLVLLDIMLEDMDGYEILYTLKEDPRTKNIPIVMVSAKGAEDDIQKGLDLGADDYIVKPIHAGLFLKRVKTVLEANRMN